MCPSLADNYHRLLERVHAVCMKSGRDPDTVRLVAVTKTQPVELLQALIDLGITHLGENRVQEITAKVPLLTGTFSLHCIGHLQTNKVAKALPLCHWIDSIDRVKLVKTIERHHGPNASPLQALVQVNTSNEATKEGCTPQACRDLCERVVASPALSLRGLMTVGPLSGDERLVRDSFSRLRQLGEKCHDLCSEPELSMGMSSDFEWAIAEGSTQIRIGSALTGARRYP